MAIEIKREMGISGLARVNIGAKGLKVAFVDTGETYMIAPEDAPDYLKESGTYSVMLSTDTTKIVSVRPVKSSHFVKFVGFKHADNMPPVPMMIRGGVRSTRDGKRWVEEDHLEFTALFKIVSGKYKDFMITQRVPYAFKVFGDEMGIMGSGSRKLENFLISVGIDFSNDVIPASDNCLPDVEKLVLKKNALLVCPLNDDGWIDKAGLSPAPEGTKI